MRAVIVGIITIACVAAGLTLLIFTIPSSWWVEVQQPKMDDVLPPEQLEGTRIPVEMPTNELPRIDVAKMTIRVEKFCGDCHALPQPATFSKADWFQEIHQGFDFYKNSGRSDLDPPEPEEVLAWYWEFAPENLKLPTAGTLENNISLKFVEQPQNAPEPTEPFPSVSNVEMFITDGTRRVVISDMKVGNISFHDIDGSGRLTESQRVVMKAPANIKTVDFDSDGRLDVVVADLGTFDTGDYASGQVVWLKSQPDGSFLSIPLARNLGRVADVDTADFDGDGDLDLVVAEFGYLKTGGIIYLRNAGIPVPENGTSSALNEKWAQENFKLIVLDDRHGAINVPIVDLDGDGDFDFIALVSQEYEVVDAWINDGNGNFEKKNVFDPKNPSYGSSGLELVDLDNDDDVDVLLTNGDLLDAMIMKPYHSVQWLENKGSLEFEHHNIANTPTVYHAKAADLDGDGDQDIVATAMIPHSGKFVEKEGHGGRVEATSTRAYAQLVVIEQTAPREFTPNPLAAGDLHCARFEITDLNDDDRPDLVLGHYYRQKPHDGPMPLYQIWLNETEQKGKLVSSTD
jgi:hypothetical protein